MSPRLVGPRFEGHAIPLGVLSDLSVLEEMIVEVAKWVFLQENPDCKRTPRGFMEGIELKLTAVEDGSARPVIALFLAASAMLLVSPKSYLEKARDSLVQAVGAAEQNKPVTGFLPENALSYFNRLGRSLRDGEAIEFTSPARETPARLNKDTRRRLLLASATVQELTEETERRGSIPEVDQAKMTFELQLADGSRVKSSISPQHYDTIMEAFRGYRLGSRVLLQGIGRFNRNQKLQSFDAIEHMMILDPLDLRSRLDDLRELRDGWLDGKGKCLPKPALDELLQILEQSLPEDLPLPYLYPTADGGVQAEWSLSTNEISLEIDLESFSAEWHCLNLADGKEEIRSINLKDPSELGWAIRQVQDKGKGAA